jgi:ATP/maltotriose-dependent transcriptional regulator MalT
MEISGTLKDATSTSFVHVDRKGKVRSRARYKALRGVTWGAVGVVGMAPVIYGLMFGAAGVVAGGALVGFLGWRISHGVKLQRAVRLIRDERVDEARDMLTSLTRARLIPKATRALVEHNLAVCYTKRGDFETALVHWERARGLYGAKRKPSVFAQMADYSEIKTLVNVGRIGDARGRLAAKGDAPEGDYLQLQHWVAELYVLFADGKHELTDDELHARARVGLELTGGAPLLGLTAWAHHVSGDDDQAWHLLGEAIERADDPGIEQTMPLLHTWMQEHADLAEAARPEI